MRHGHLVGLMLLLASGQTWAQDAAPPAESSEPALQVEDGAFVIEGKIQKPQVIVLVRRQTLEEGIELDIQGPFLEEIVEAADEDPF